MSEIQNLTQLQKFVHAFNLIDNHGNIIFYARVSIETATNRLDNIKANIRIELDGYQPQIALLEDSIDPNLYPTVFYPKWQKIEFKDDVYLLITDTHTRNVRIGKYWVKIVPQM